MILARSRIVPMITSLSTGTCLTPGQRYGSPPKQGEVSQDYCKRSRGGRHCAEPKSNCGLYRQRSGVRSRTRGPNGCGRWLACIGRTTTTAETTKGTAIREAECPGHNILRAHRGVLASVEALYREVASPSKDTGRSAVYSNGQVALSATHSGWTDVVRDARLQQ